ncbi:MAG TPA: tetratricopeptide repeat protein [Candidatus Dormibacteraeota bacterium]
MAALFEAFQAQREGRDDEARRLFGRIAQEGDPRGAYHLARSLARGDQELEAAARWYRSAAGLGHADSAFELAGLCVLGRGVARDLTEALRWYRAAADRGHAAATRMVGVMLLRGDGGTAANAAEGIRWLEAATARGDEDAPLLLGALYERGEAVPRDPLAAARWYFHVHGPEAGRREAASGIERLRREIAQLARQGHADGQYRLGRITGDQGESARWLWAAARQGHVEASYVLAVLHREGRGVPQDLAESFRLCRVAAEAGYRPAQHDLGYMYLTGAGVAADREEGRRWYRRAAEQGDARSMFDLWITAPDGADQREEAARWLQGAAEGGYDRAVPALGRTYERADGVPRDLVQAARWLIVAQQRGAGDVAADLRDVARELTPEQLRSADRLAGGDGSAAEAALAGS